MLLILENTPEVSCMEWVLAGKKCPESVFSCLVDFEERTSCFEQQFETSTFSILKRVKKIGADGTFLYTVRFDGSILFGQEIVNYLAQEFNLVQKTLLYYLPNEKSVAQTKRMVEELGFTFVQSTDVIYFYKKRDVALFISNQGLYLQIRGKHHRDWRRLTHQLHEITAPLSIEMKRKKSKKRIAS